MDKISEKMIKEAQEDLNEATVVFINNLVIIADKYKWDRDILINFAVLKMAEIARVGTFKEYEVKEGGND